MTDAAGGYTFNVDKGNYTFRFVPTEGSGYLAEYADDRYAAPVPVLYASSRTLQPAVLNKSVDASGRVHLESGGVVGAGEVEIAATLVGHSELPALTAVTDEDGRWSFPGVHRGVYTYTFTPVGITTHTVLTAGFNFNPSGPSLDVMATLPRLNKITGQVHLGSVGNLATAGEVTVVLMTKDWSGYGMSTRAATAVTDADGRYVFEGLPTNQKWLYDVEVDPFGSYLGTFLDSDGVYFPLRGSDVTRDILLRRTGSISGQVRASSGEPLSGIAVTTDRYQDDGIYLDTWNAESGSDGRWKIDPAHEGNHFVEFVDPSGVFAPVHLDGTSAYVPRKPLMMERGIPKSGFTVTMPKASSLSGQISGLSSEQVAEGSIEVELLAPKGSGWQRTGTVWEGEADGSFVIPGLSPGAFRFAVRYEGPQGDSFRMSSIIRFLEGQHKTISVSLTQPGTSGGFRDFSGDAKGDVLARTSSGTLVQYIGDGAGGWAGSKPIGSGWNAMNLIAPIGDVTGDGNADVIARDGRGAAYLYRGDARGGLSTKRLLGTGWGAFTAIFSPGDWDGDGAGDLVTRDAAGAMWLHRGNGMGGFSGLERIATGWASYRTVFGVGDFSGDGAPDLMARDASGRLWLFPGNGAGGFMSKVQVASGWGSFTAVFGPGDFTGDGNPDVMARDAGGVLWLHRGDGAGGFSTKSKVGTGWNSRTILG